MRVQSAHFVSEMNYSIIHEQYKERYTIHVADTPVYRYTGTRHKPPEIVGKELN